MFKGVFINEVCNLFDIQVLHDMEPLSDNEDDMSFKSVVAIGWNAEPDAGIRYGVVTPWFSTEEELDAFCERNIEAFREAAVACDNGAPVVDATEWK